MSTASFPHKGFHGIETGHRTRTLTTIAFAINLAYLAWFWVAFALGYWVYSWFGLDPSSAAISDQGTLGWLALIGYGLVAGLPSWVGAVYSVRASHAGAGHIAHWALFLNLMVGTIWLAVVALTG